MREIANDTIGMSPNAAARAAGISRSYLYLRLAAGDIRAVKCGARTLVLADSLRAFVASLPAAEFRAPTKAA